VILKVKVIIINHNKMEIEKLKQKLLEQEKYEIELKDINKKYKVLVNKMNEKNNNIQNLEKANKNFENKINLSNAKHKKLLNEQNDLKEKLNQLEELCNQYELAFRKIKMDENNYNTKKENIIYNNDYNFNYNKGIKARNNKLNNDNNINNYRNRNYYHHKKYRNVIEDDNYGHTFNYKKYSNDLIRKKYDKNVFDNNNNKNYDFKYKFNTNRNIKKSNIDYIKQSNKMLDKSFGYSNYLLDALKNKISEIHFDSKY